MDMLSNTIFYILFHKLSTGSKSRWTCMLIRSMYARKDIDRCGHRDIARLIPNLHCYLNKKHTIKLLDCCGFMLVLLFTRRIPGTWYRNLQDVYRAGRTNHTRHCCASRYYRLKSKSSHQCGNRTLRQPHSS